MLKEQSPRKFQTESSMFSNPIVASRTGPALSNFQGNIHGFFDLTFKVLLCPSVPSFITPSLIQSTKPSQSDLVFTAQSTQQCKLITKVKKKKNLFS